MRKWTVLLLLFTACSEEHSEYLNTSAQGAFDGVTFVELRDELFEPHCVKCHHAYNEAVTIRRDLKAILEQIQGAKMPPGEPLAPGLIDQLKAWADAGATD